jgi:hypothetical protein
MTKLTELPEISTLADGDLIYIVQASGPTSVGITKANFGGGLPAGTVITSELDRITDPVGGEFDFTIPSGYDRIYVEGRLRGTAAGTSDGIHWFANEEVTTTDYFSQQNWGFATTSFAPQENSPRCGYMPATTAPAGAFGWFRLQVEDPDGSALKDANTIHGAKWDASTGQSSGQTNSRSPTAAPLTRLRIKGDIAGCTGTLILYGERTL